MCGARFHASVLVEERRSSPPEPRQLLPCHHSMYSMSRLASTTRCSSYVSWKHTCMQIRARNMPLKQTVIGRSLRRIVHSRDDRQNSQPWGGAHRAGGPREFWGVSDIRLWDSGRSPGAPSFDSTHAPKKQDGSKYKELGYLMPYARPLIC